MSDLEQRVREFARTNKTASPSRISRAIGIDYGLAARFVERMEADGLVSPPAIGLHGGRRYIGPV